MERNTTAAEGRDREQGRPHITICGIIAIVFGALGLVLSFIPIINNIAAIFGFIGAVLAIIALVGTFRGKRSGKALSVVAAVLCVLSIVITLAVQSAASKALDDSVKESKGVDTSQSASGSGNGDSSKNKTSGEQDTEGDIEGAHVKIVSAAASGADYNGAATVLVTYEWMNKTTKNNSFSSLAHPQVFQNGKSLDIAMYTQSPEGYDANSYLAEVQPGATATVTLGYVLQDQSPVTVDVTALMSMDDATKVVHTFDLQ